jgi:hypothetical protein
MKIFISWSGERSHQAAVVVRDWLPDVIQLVEPFVSSEDIAKGRRWGNEITQRLDSCQFGIICLTRANLASNWVHFEAGAISQKFTEGRVSCLLIDLSPTDVRPPLALFQNTRNDPDDVYKLVSSINALAGERALQPDRLKRAFDSHWPKFHQDVKNIENKSFDDETAAKQAPRRDPLSIAEETLETVRNIERRLADRSAALAGQVLKAETGHFGSPAPWAQNFGAPPESTDPAHAAVLANMLHRKNLKVPGVTDVTPGSNVSAAGPKDWTGDSKEKGK